MNKRIIDTVVVVFLLAVIAVAANSYPDHVSVDGQDRNIKAFTVLASTVGDNKLVDGVSGHVIKLLYFGVRSYSDTSSDWYLKNDTNADLWGSAAAPFTSAQNGIDGPPGEFMPFTSVGSIATKTAGEDLEINVSAPLWVTGNYVIVPTE